MVPLGFAFSRHRVRLTDLPEGILEDCANLHNAGFTLGVQGEGSSRLCHLHLAPQRTKQCLRMGSILQKHSRKIHAVI